MSDDVETLVFVDVPFVVRIDPDATAPGETPGEAVKQAIRAKLRTSHGSQVQGVGSVKVGGLHLADVDHVPKDTATLPDDLPDVDLDAAKDVPFDYLEDDTHD